MWNLRYRVSSFFSGIFSLFGSSSPFATPIATVIPRRNRPMEITPVKPLASVVMPTCCSAEKAVVGREELGNAVKGEIR